MTTRYLTKKECLKMMKETGMNLDQLDIYLGLYNKLNPDNMVEADEKARIYFRSIS